MANRLRRPHQPPQRSYGWDRTMIATTEGARGVLAHNLIKISALAG
jgi:hypothetical protein